MEVKNKYHKTKLCRYYENYGKCSKGNSCTYAHGIDELKKKNCFNGLDCFKKYCQFEHPDGWNPEKNKKICKYYINSYCDKGDMCKFKHVKNIIEEKDKKDKNNNSEIIKKNEDIDINDDNEFPYLKEKTISNIIKTTNNVWENFYDRKKENNIDEIKNKNQNNNLSPNIEVLVNSCKYNNENNIKSDKNKEKEKELLNSDYVSDTSKLSNITLTINEVGFKDTKNKIDEEEIYNKVINDEELMQNYKKHNNSNNENLLDICENNIQIMNKYLTEHINIIKSNFNEFMIESHDPNFLNYCINTKMLLNSITVNSSLLEKNFKDYKYFLQKNNN